MSCDLGQETASSSDTPPPSTQHVLENGSCGDPNLPPMFDWKIERTQGSGLAKLGHHSFPPDRSVSLSESTSAPSSLDDDPINVPRNEMKHIIPSRSVRHKPLMSEERLGTKEYTTALPPDYRECIDAAREIFSKADEYCEESWYVKQNSSFPPTAPVSSRSEYSVGKSLDPIHTESFFSCLELITDYVFNSEGLSPSNRHNTLMCKSQIGGDVDVVDTSLPHRANQLEEGTQQVTHDDLRRLLKSIQVHHAITPSASNRNRRASGIEESWSLFNKTTRQRDCYEMSNESHEQCCALVSVGNDHHSNIVRNRLVSPERFVDPHRSNVRDSVHGKQMSFYEDPDRRRRIEEENVGLASPQPTAEFMSPVELLLEQFRQQSIAAKRSVSTMSMPSALEF